MTISRLDKFGPCIALLVGITACGMNVGSGAEIDPKLGPTVMTRCAIVSGETVSFDNLAAELSIYADANGLKFLNDKTSGAYGTYLQADDPYIVINHLFFPQRDPPEHMLVTFRSTSGEEGQPIEDAFYEFLGGIAPLSSCGEYRAAITSGWRLKD
jgi:hypothetical protein